MTAIRSETVPASIEAEQCLLSAVLLKGELMDLVCEQVTAADFYDQRHRVIFETMEQMHAEGVLIDLVAVAAKTDAKECGGILYLSSLTDYAAHGVIPLTGYARQWAGIIAEKSRSRALIDAANRAMKQALSGVPTDDVIDRLHRLTAPKEGKGQGQANMEQAASRAMAAVEELMRPGKTPGVFTGYRDLDAMLGGLQPGELTILAARPSMGKTALAMNIATNAARAGHYVLVFSMEMSEHALVARLFSSVATIPLSQILSGDLDQMELEHLRESAQAVAALPMSVDDTGGLTVGQLMAKARLRATKATVGLVVVDYLQLMSSTLEENRERQVAEISRGLKLLARTLSAPVLALAQLNRAVESRPGSAPRLSDLRDSGAIEQDADKVLLIHRFMEGPGKGTADIIVGKNRNGPVGKISLKFQGPYCRFDNALI